MSDAEQNMRLFKEALQVTAAERRNLVLECKEVREFREHLDNERRSLVNELKYLKAERSQLSTTMACFNSVLEEMKQITTRLHEEAIVVKRLEDSIASIQKSIAQMRLELLHKTQSSSHDERKHPVSKRKIPMVMEETENKRPKFEGNEPREGRNGKVGKPRRSCRLISEGPIEDLHKICNGSDADSGEGVKKRPRRRRLSEVEKLQASLKTMKWTSK